LGAAGFFVAALPASAGPASGADIAAELVVAGIAEAEEAGIAEADEAGIADVPELAGMSDGMPASGVSMDVGGVTGGVGLSPPQAATIANGARTRSLKVRMGS
jgi:hypothetical protein